MRITCPNCTTSFEIPTELLGKRGRSLKCASCGHSWYQTLQVETIDLAEIMGQEYAARATAATGPAIPHGAAEKAVEIAKAVSAAPAPGQSAAPPQAPARGGSPGQAGAAHRGAPGG